jgi:hypothetical protein
MKLPKAEQKLAEWQTATGILIGAAEGPRFPDACTHRHAARAQSTRRKGV